jgi:hypothetical protein
MKLITIEELEVGDEILISCQSYFKYLRVLRKPTLSTRKKYQSDEFAYNSVKCSCNKKSEEKTYTYGKTVRKYVVNTWQITPEDHNTVQYLDLSNRQVLLVKKNYE